MHFQKKLQETVSAYLVYKNDGILCLRNVNMTTRKMYIHHPL